MWMLKKDKKYGIQIIALKRITETDTTYNSFLKWLYDYTNLR